MFVTFSLWFNFIRFLFLTLYPDYISDLHLIPKHSSSSLYLFLLYSCLYSSVPLHHFPVFLICSLCVIFPCIALFFIFFPLLPTLSHPSPSLTSTTTICMYLSVSLFQVLPYILFQLFLFYLLAIFSMYLDSVFALVPSSVDLSYLSLTLSKPSSLLSSALVPQSYNATLPASVIHSLQVIHHRTALTLSKSLSLPYSAAI